MRRDATYRSVVVAISYGRSSARILSKCASRNAASTAARLDKYRSPGRDPLCGRLQTLGSDLVGEHLLPDLTGRSSTGADCPRGNDKRTSRFKDSPDLLESGVRI